MGQATLQLEMQPVNVYRTTKEQIVLNVPLDFMITHTASVMIGVESECILSRRMVPRKS